jgi:hypothetical protein
MEPFAPDSPDSLPKLAQPWAIARQAVVGMVTSEWLNMDSRELSYLALQRFISVAFVN